MLIPAAVYAAAVRRSHGLCDCLDCETARAVVELRRRAAAYGRALAATEAVLAALCDEHREQYGRPSRTFEPLLALVREAREG